MPDKTVEIGGEIITLRNLFLKFGISEQDCKKALIIRCMECDAIAEVLETRKRKSGTYRRYRCTDEDCSTRFSTIDGQIQKESIVKNDY